MKVTLKLIRVGMNMREATISGWFKQPGEHFNADDPLYSIKTEKVIQDIEASAPGKLLKILVDAGQEAAVGDPSCVVDLLPGASNPA